MGRSAKNPPKSPTENQAHTDKRLDLNLISDSFHLHVVHPGRCQNAGSLPAKLEKGIITY